jgi:hypothetical protein
MNKTTSLLALLLVGCAKPPTTTDKLPIAQTVHETAEKVPPLSPFQGKRDKPITWDLWGDWHICNVETPGRTTHSPRWEESWHPRQRTDKSRLVWLDPIRGELFAMFHTPQGDIIRWRRHRGRIVDFSVNEQHYGVLLMTDQDGESYLATRQDGGE